MRVWVMESFSVVEKVIVVGDDIVERFLVIFNILGLINNEFKCVRVERLLFI